MGKIRYWQFRIQAHLNRNFWDERKVKFGTLHPDKTFYVIRRNDPSVGLFSYYIYVLGHIKYALDQGWIPIVDMQYYANQYLDRQSIGKKNAWEYYFCQPSSDEYSIDEVYQSKNVVLCKADLRQNMPSLHMDYLLNNEQVRLWRDIAKCIKCIDAVEQKVDEVWSEMQLESRSVMGVLLRGSDYTALKPKNHPVQPEIEEALQYIEKRLKKYGYEKIFIATEDRDILQSTIKRFGDKVLYFEAERYAHDVNMLLCNIRNKRLNDAYLRGMEYLIPICILGRLGYLFAGRTSGSVAVPLIGRNEYIACDYWDSGYYG